MRYFLTAFLLCVASLRAADDPPAAWKTADGPLFTRWAKDVSPDHALPEYPRPQMVRPQWTNLNGLWDYAVTPKDAAAPPEAFAGKILVPFPIEAPLSGVKRALKPDERLWYRRTFDTPKLDFAGERRLLHFGAVDWQAAASVNGKPVGEHKGGYDPFTCDITDALKPDGPQEIVVNVYDPTDTGDQPLGTDKYVNLLDQVRTLRDHDGLAGAIYTQLTDVEIECSGLLTYDRALIHADVARAAAANRAVQTAP